MNCKCVLQLLLLLTLSVPLTAAEKTQNEVRTVVEQWVQHVTADARPDGTIEKMEPYTVNGRTVAYIAYLSGDGFCLCGADDLLLPVYIYSPHGTFDPENRALQYFLWEIGARREWISSAQDNRAPALQSYATLFSSRQKLWSDLASGILPTPSVGQAVASVIPDSMIVNLTSRWHQGSPYNDQCPVLTPGSDEHAVTGCVATAMAQIMYYWKWPSTGTGSNFFYYFWRWRSTWDEEPLSAAPTIPAGWENLLQWTSANGGRLRMTGYWDVTRLWVATDIKKDDPLYTAALNALWNRLKPESTLTYANFGATTYDWSLLRDVHADPPDAGDAEVAKLCYHVGVSIYMKYGLHGSGADDIHIGQSLRDHFSYDPDVAYAYPPNIDRMTEDIQYLRPVAMGGSNDKGEGHEWVVHGYNAKTDPNRQFLINFGWGGASVWYSCDQVEFHHDQSITTRISPLSVVRYVPGPTSPWDGTPASPYLDFNQAITAAPDGTTLIIRAGSEITFSTSEFILNRPLTLTGHDVIIRKQ